MPYKNESMVMGGDASADTSTQLCFNPPEGPFVGDNVVKGTIAHRHDEDWIAIKLTEGNTYTITVGGSQTMGELNDSVLKLMTGKGGFIKENDDDDGAKGKLGSVLKFTPEVGSGTQTYFISVSGNTDNPGANNTGSYTVKVKEEAALLEGEGADIEGTDMADKLTGTADGESIAGLGGDDTINGGGGDDTLFGGDDNDLLIGGPGGDELKGGKGTDTISYKYSMEGVMVNLLSGFASGGEASRDKIGADIEYIEGSMYDDVLTGNNEVNHLWGLGGDDSLDGDGGDDMLNGGPGNDNLDGENGDDTLIGGPGEDNLIGGRGSDTASYAGSTMGVTVRLHANQAMGGDAEGDEFGRMVEFDYVEVDEDGETHERSKMVPDIMNLTGSSMNDNLAGDGRDNVIDGGAGDDKLYGGPIGGDDVMFGGAGDDMVFGGKGDDELFGDGGESENVDKTVVVNARMAGNDTLKGGPGSNTMSGGPGNDTFVIVRDKGSARDEADGGDDMDTISYKDWVDDDDGDGVTVDLSDGDATSNTTEVSNIEHIYGSRYEDNLTGDAMANRIEGQEDADTLSGGVVVSAADYAGAADDAARAALDINDTLSYATSDDGVRVDLNADAATPTEIARSSGGHASGDTVTFNTFEHIVGSDHDDDLVGSALPNIIEGGAGEDDMDGGDGGNGATANSDATMADVLSADNNDTLSYRSSDGAVIVNLASLSFSGGDAAGDSVETFDYDPDGTGDKDEFEVSSFENVTGSANDDRLTGDFRANVLNGLAGDDNLKGAEGADTLIGGPGADNIDGGKSLAVEDDESTTDVDESMQHRDVASFATAELRGVVVDLDSQRGLEGDAEGDTYKNIEHFLGSMHDDTFIAGEDADDVDASGHDDDGGDTISYAESEVGVTIDLGVQDGTAAQPSYIDANDNNSQDEDEPDVNVEGSYARGDVLQGFENVIGSGRNDHLTGSDEAINTLKGGLGVDMLFAGDGVTVSVPTDSDGDGDIDNDDTPVDVLFGDTLMGEGGNDELTGDAGRDTLMGGAGNDEIDGGAENDKIVGGAGHDDLTGGTGADTFVFSPADGTGDDKIVDFTVDTTNVPGSDKIDLTAFGLDEDGLEDIIDDNLSTRGQSVIVDLTEVGGGLITLQTASETAADALLTTLQGTGGDDFFIIA